MGEVIGIGEVVTRELKAEGIECGFGITGFHSEMLYALFPAYGMSLYTGRHEQWGPYAADGYAGASRKMAICYGTAGPGVTNMVSGIAQAYQNYRPMVCMCGMHTAPTDRHWALQEAYPVDILKSCCKEAYEITDADSVLYWIRRACKVAREYPPGPVVLAVKPNVLGWTKDVDEYAFTYPRDKVAYPISSAADPQAVTEAVEMILSAKRPLMFAGDGVFWAHAEEELREFVEVTQTPVSCRRAARGSVPDDHPLGVSPLSRGDIRALADLYILIGMHDSTTEGAFTTVRHGGPWADGVPFLQINEAQCDLIDFVPTKMQLLGNPKKVLKQMIECARDLLKERKPEREEWLKTIRESAKKAEADMAQKAQEQWSQSPVGGGAWKKVIRDFVNDYPETTVILDSFTGSFWASDGYICRFPGQSLDSGGWSGVGHGIPMGFGAQVARPGKPVLVIGGDGGLGISGMEIETCARYKMPVVTILWNNSQWMGPLHEFMYSALAGDNKLSPNIRYDRMFGALEWVHVEYCTKNDELRPALERSFNSGKTSLINCIVEPFHHHPWIGGVPLVYLRWYGKEPFLKYMPKISRDWVEAQGGPDKVYQEMAGRPRPPLYL